MKKINLIYILPEMKGASGGAKVIYNHSIKLADKILNSNNSFQVKKTQYDTNSGYSNNSKKDQSHSLQQKKSEKKVESDNVVIDIVETTNQIKKLQTKTLQKKQKKQKKFTIKKCIFFFCIFLFISVVIGLCIILGIELSDDNLITKDTTVSNKYNSTNKMLTNIITTTLPTTTLPTTTLSTTLSVNAGHSIFFILFKIIKAPLLPLVTTIFFPLKFTPSGPAA